jgi:hypothetical protein
MFCHNLYHIFSCYRPGVYIAVVILTWVDLRMRLALSMGHSGAGVFIHSFTETNPVSETLCSLEYRTMDTVQKPSNSDETESMKVWKVCLGSAQWLWGRLTSGMWNRAIWYKFIDASKQRTASMFRVDYKEASCVFSTCFKYWSVTSCRLIACLAYTFNLITEAVRSSETSVNFCWATTCHIPESDVLQAWMRFNRRKAGVL